MKGNTVELKISMPRERAEQLLLEEISHSDLDIESAEYNDVRDSMTIKLKIDGKALRTMMKEALEVSCIGADLRIEAIYWSAYTTEVTFGLTDQPVEPEVPPPAPGTQPIDLEV